MPQWTLAVVWQNLFNSNAVTGTSDGLIASLFGINMPKYENFNLFSNINQTVKYSTQDYKNYQNNQNI